MANPYDEVGVAHNTILANFFTNYSKERVIREQMSKYALFQFVCATAALPDCDAMQALADHKFVQLLPQMSLVEVTNYLQDKGITSEAVTAYLIEMDKQVVTHVQSRYDVYYRSIVAIENKIMVDTKLTETERIQLLTSSSVARHSGKFWKDVSEGTTSYAGLAHLPIAMNDTLKDLITQDMAGATIGIYGSMFIGSGNPISMVKSALIVAAIGSIGRAAVKYWNWSFR